MRFIAEVFRFRSVGKLKRRNRRAAAHRISATCGHLGGVRLAYASRSATSLTRRDRASRAGAECNRRSGRGAS